MTPINFALPGFFKKASGFDGIQEDMPPITDDILAFFDPEYAVFSDEGNTLAADGNNIRQIWDRTSSGNTLNQTTAIYQPVYKTGVIGNGKASIQSNGDFFLTTNNIEIPNTQLGWTFYAVYKRSSGSDEYYISTLSTNALNRMEWRSVHMIRSNGSGRYIAFTDDLDTKIVSYTLDRNAGTLKMYINGLFYGFMSESTQITDWPLEFNKLFNSSYGVNFGNQLWYNDAHSADQVLKVSEWLGEKYDILVAPITENLEFYISPDKKVYSDAGTTLATDGDSIRQINDLSGNDNTIEQSTASNQFEYVEDHFGTGKSAIYKNIANGPHMDFASTLSIDSDTTGGITFYSVYDKTNNSQISYLFGTTDGNFNRILEYGNHSIYFQDENDEKHYASITDTKDLAIRAFTLDTSTDTVTTYDNGVLDSSSSLSKTWGTFNFDSFWGGANTSYIGDTLLFSDVHDATQIAKMTNWLNDKYEVFDPYAPPITDDLGVYFNPDFDVYSDAGTTLATDGDYIREWDDRSGNDNDLEQPTGSSQLKYKTSLLNSSNGVEATSNTDMLLSSNISLQGCTIYAVNKKDNTSAEMMPAGGSGNITIGNNYSDGNTYLFDGVNNVSVNTGHFTDWGVRAYVWDYGTDFEVFENNSSLGSVSATNVGSITIDRLFGRGNGSAGTKNSMEILVFTDTHDATQIEQMSDWLNTKYDIYDPYAPPITDDLELYFNPDVKVYSDAGSTLAVDGENIRQIKDRSGNDNTLNQITGSYQPVYSTSTLGNGNSSIHIDASNFFNLSSTVEIGSSDSFTMYVVYKKGTNTRNSVISGPGSSNSDRIDLRVSYVQSFIGGTNSFISHSDNSDLKIITVVVDRSDNTYKVYKDGTSIGSNSRTFGAVDYTKMFGGIIPGGNIDYGNVLLYKDAHSSTEVGTMSDWLNEKYDIY